MYYIQQIEDRCSQRVRAQYRVRYSSTGLAFLPPKLRGVAFGSQKQHQLPSAHSQLAQCPAQLGVSSAPAGVPRPRCSLLAALYSDHQMTLPLWKLGLLLPNPFDENFVCAISRQKPNYSSHVPQGRFYELNLGLSRSSRAGAETLRLQITYSVGGASYRKMSLGFYCLPDVMSSWLYPISIADILKSIKT